MPAAMNSDEFEQAYDVLARALDRAGPERERLFLARLALALAHRMPDLAVFAEAVAIAESDLEAHPDRTASTP